jgi:ABC-type transport system substrate-binding protein
MRRICVLLSFVVLAATTLAVGTSAPVTADGAQAITATNPSDTAALAACGRSDVRIGFRPALKLRSSALNGPTTFSPHTGQDRSGCVFLLDGNDRWRSLLLGAPPLFA